MQRNVLLGLCLAVAFGTAGCQDRATEPTGPSVEAPNPYTTLGRVALERGRIVLPSSVRMSDRYFADLPRRAITPGDYVCNPEPSPVFQIFIDEFREFANDEPAIFDLIFNVHWADLIPQWEALYLLTEDTRQVFGYHGEYTRVLQQTEVDTKRFWDIRSGDIQLVAMKGSMLLDRRRVADTYRIPFIPPYFGLKKKQASSVASEVGDAMLESVVLDRGNHTLFSFNAFAITDEEGTIPDKIVMGDGILDAYGVVGYGDVAPQAIYAHEFGHHIQFENGYFEDDVPGATTQAELTRYTELMADAFSAYYLTNKRGQGMKKKRVKEFLDVFFQIGDCDFGSDGHHGTPNQRMRAAQFGFNVADQSSVKNEILTSDQFHDLFVAEYPRLVAPDATT
jgi:hypothetical protein